VALNRALGTPQEFSVDPQSRPTGAVRQITDKIPAPGDTDLPEKLRVGFPLDGEPHRGRSLRRLGIAAITGGALSLYPVTAVVGVPVGLALGIAIWTRARRDLDRMRQGLMDPRGVTQTEEARQLGKIAVILATTLGVLWAVILACWLSLQQTGLPWWL